MMIEKPNNQFVLSELSKVITEDTAKKILEVFYTMYKNEEETQEMFYNRLLEKMEV